MGVEVDERNSAVTEHIRGPTRGAQGDRMVSSEDEWNRPCADYLPHRLSHVIQALLEISGSHNEVPDVDDIDDSERIDTRRQVRPGAVLFEVVGSANRIRPTDTQRIQRALEVYELSGESLSELQQNASVSFDGKIEKIILAAYDRARLHQRIETRFRGMLEQGFVEEVTRLKARSDLNLLLPSMRCVGYRQIWQYLDGELTHQQMIEKGVAATRQLAKRQITWLRKQVDEKAFDCLNYRKDAIFRLVEAAFSGL